MLVYVWSREFPNANINIYGLVTLKVCECWLVIILQSFCVFTKLQSFFSLIHIWCMDVHKILIAGILSTMGHACFRCHFWFTYCTRSSGNLCRASLLLFDRVTSTGWWEEHTEDSNVVVSFFFFQRWKYILLWCSNSMLLQNHQLSLFLSGC